MTRYRVEFLNECTGERCSVVTGLTPHERADCMYHLARRGSDGPGGLFGPIARGYALARASHALPEKFLREASFIITPVTLEAVQ